MKKQQTSWRIFLKPMLAAVCNFALLATLLLSGGALSSIAESDVLLLNSCESDLVGRALNSATLTIDSEKFTEGTTSYKVTTSATGTWHLATYMPGSNRTAGDYKLVDVTGYDVLRFDVYVEHANQFTAAINDRLAIYLSGNGELSDDGSYLRRELPVNEWVTITIPMSVASSYLDASTGELFCVSMYNDHGATDAALYGASFWVDNIRLEKTNGDENNGGGDEPGEDAPALTDSQLLSDCEGDLAFGAANGAVAVVDTAIKSQGEGSFKVTTNTTSTRPAGAFNAVIVLDGAYDPANYDVLSFDVYVENANMLAKTTDLYYYFGDNKNLYDNDRWLRGEANALTPGEWTTISIPVDKVMGALSGSDIVYFGMMDTAGTKDASLAGQSFWIDNIRLEKTAEDNIGGGSGNENPGENQPVVPDTLLIVDCEGEDLVFGAANGAIASVDTTIKSQGEGSFKVITNTTSTRPAGAFNAVMVLDEAVNPAGYDVLRFDVYVENANILAMTTDLYYYVAEGKYVYDGGKYLRGADNALTPGEWTTVTIPLSAFSDKLDNGKMTQFGMMDTAGTKDASTAGSAFWIDNIRLEKVEKHTISSTAGENGTISPSGEVEVIKGLDQSFTLTPAEGYVVDTLLVDGAAVAVPEGAYTFKNVTENHNIAVTFKKYEKEEKAPLVLNNCERSEAGVCLNGGSIEVDTTFFNEGAGSYKVTLEPNAGTYNLCTYNFNSSRPDGYYETANPTGYDVLRFDVYSEYADIFTSAKKLEFYVSGNGVMADSPYIIGEELVSGEWCTITIPVTALQSYLDEDGNIFCVALMDQYGTNNKELAGKSFWIDNVRLETIPYYTVTATAGENGTITPAGETTLGEGSKLVYTFEAEPDHMIDSVLVDGTAVEYDAENSTYTFVDLDANHTIEVTFKESPNNYYSIISSVTGNGSISPAGEASIREGNKATYTFAPDAGYMIETLLVDGKAVELTSSFTFKNVKANHTIEASFVKIPDTDLPGQSSTVLYDAETLGTMRKGTATLDASNKSQGAYSLKLSSSAIGDIDYEIQVPAIETAGYEYLAIDVYALDYRAFWCTNHLWFGVVAGENYDDEHTRYLKREVATNMWNTVYIPLSAFGEDLTELSYFCIGMDNGRWDGLSETTVWVDNIRLITTEEVEVESEKLLAEEGSENYRCAVGLSIADSEYVSNGDEAIYVLSETGEWDFYLQLDEAVNASQYKYLQFDVLAKDVKTFWRHRYMGFSLAYATTEASNQLIDAGQYLNGRLLENEVWTTVTIPLSAFEGIADLENVDVFRFYAPAFQPQYEAEFWIDNIRFSSDEEVVYQPPTGSDDNDNGDDNGNDNNDNNGNNDNVGGDNIDDGNTESPDTGDKLPVLPIILVVLCSAVAMLTVRKKRSQATN